MKKLPDERYSINLEYCGYEDWRFVLRFCGDWVSQHKTELQAVKACRDHRAQFIKQFLRETRK